MPTHRRQLSTFSAKLMQGQGANNTEHATARLELMQQPHLREFSLDANEGDLGVICSKVFRDVQD